MNFHFLTAHQFARNLTRQSLPVIRDFHAPQSRFNARMQRRKDAEVCSHTEDTADTENNEKPETRNSILLPQIPHSALRTPRLDRVRGKGALNLPRRKLLSLFANGNFPTPHSAFRTPRYSERAIALVITLILLSIITFMAVTFLVVSRRERGAVTTMTDQANATFANNAAVERAKAQLIAAMLAQTNGLNSGLVVSTNYINPLGFQSGAGASSFTNVNYDHQFNSPNPLSQSQFLQNLTNLFYDPRPPVFIVTNKNPAFPPDFRYYLDLNRNGRYDTNGVGPLLNNLNQVITDASGNPITNNFFVGDPEWIGITERPEFPHSATNKFVARYAFLVLPVGNSLDLNAIHNQAKRLGKTADGFLRNQGVGTWEINLAAFLHDLNTNTYAWGAPGAYNYVTNNGAFAAGSSGVDFNDAAGFLAYRYNDGFNSSYNSLRSVASLFGAPGNAAFTSDFIDGYSAGPLMTGVSPLAVDSDPIAAPWSGANNTNHYFTSQDLFNSIIASANGNAAPNGNLADFTNRLFRVGFNTNSYDRYTYYTLLSQMGIDSAPESPTNTMKLNQGITWNKVNLNYSNAVGVSATAAPNFTPWTNAVQFFTNAAEAMLRQQFGGNIVGMLQPYPVLLNPFTNVVVSITNIPVCIGTNFVYSPAVNRILQLAANIFDAANIRTFDGTPFTGNNAYPSVFRPTFRAVPGINGGSNVFINGFVEEGPNTTSYQSIPLSLPEQSALVGPNTTNIYGVPWIIGAKKGFPNFNELSVETVAQITRKLKITKPSLTAARTLWTTNQMYVIGISNAFGVEAWNSYSNAYSRSVQIIAANDLTMVLTNAYGLRYTTNLLIGGGTNIGANQWNGSPKAALKVFDPRSFQIPLYTNFVFIPDSIYHQNPPGLVSITSGFEQIQGSNSLIVPNFALGTTNRLRFIMRDSATGRIIDYVSLNMNGTNSVRQLTSEQPQAAQGIAGLGGIWNTNLVNGVAQGIGVQIAIGAAVPGYTLSDIDWRNAQAEPLVGQTKASEITKFQGFYFANGTSTDLVAQVPFSPTSKIVQNLFFQANDPLVHFTLSDLSDLKNSTNGLQTIRPPNGVIAPLTAQPGGLGLVNLRYQPWGGNPLNPDPATQYSLNLKDPLVTKSDDWDFPTNKFPNLGWLGRVHRGTPWQTVYLKSTPVDHQLWQLWSGDGILFDIGTQHFFESQLTEPMNDWKLLDVFSSAFNDNATRGQLSINQTNVAAWSATLSGVITLTNNTGGAGSISPYVIDPVINSAAISNIVTAINDVRRTNFAGGVFEHLGDILAVPELTTNSPFLNVTNAPGSQTAGIVNSTVSDEVYERIPQQILSLLRVGQPRYVIYAYGQSLKPADRSIVQTSGPYFGMCTNYQITGEVVTRTVMRVENYPVPFQPSTAQLNTPPPLPQPRVIVESFNVLPPE
jgi:hypothetical protein